MGIVNVTPDSFYEGSRANNSDHQLRVVEKMLKEGAAIVDVGGQSTRPGSNLVSATEEMSRVIPAIEAIHKHFPELIISVDTFYGIVVKEAAAAGAGMVNDVSGGTRDTEILAIAGSLPVPYVCMHTKGTPKTMQQNPCYENVAAEVLDFFVVQTTACKKAGINDVIIDPGFGFGKTQAHNFELLKNLSLLKILNKPVLIGLSRKSMVYKPLQTTSGEALNGTTALHMLALQNGASILRVHDVKEAVEVVKLYEEYSRV
jgi:dihydropteroate synthase